MGPVRLDPDELASFEEVLAWVKRAKDPAETLQRTLGLQAFVESHPRIRRAAEEYRREKQRPTVEERLSHYFDH